MLLTTFLDMMITRPISFLKYLSLLVLATAYCTPAAAANGQNPIGHNTLGVIQKATPKAGLTWIEAMDRLRDQGYDTTEVVHRLDGGCWEAEAFVLRMRTTFFVDRDGKINTEFPPDSCQ